MPPRAGSGTAAGSTASATTRRRRSACSRSWTRARASDECGSFSHPLVANIESQVNAKGSKERGYTQDTGGIFALMNRPKADYQHGNSHGNANVGVPN